MRQLEVIPAVLSKTREDMAHKISLVSPYVKTIHIDMMDGKFVPNATLSAEETAKTLPPDKSYIFHWMVEKPEEEIPKLGRLAAKSLHVVHAEVLGLERWNALKNARHRLGVAINPETPLAKIGPYINETNYFLVMFVHPGFSNQKYIPEVEDKLRELRERRPDADIEVDGGISAATAPGAVAAGANKLAAASAVFSRDNIKEAIDDILLSAKARKGG